MLEHHAVVLPPLFVGVGGLGDGRQRQRVGEVRSEARAELDPPATAAATDGAVSDADLESVAGGISAGTNNCDRNAWSTCQTGADSDI